MAPNTLKIKTRYQRMAVAVELAKLLREHSDPKVQELGQEITYVLGAPTSTLNNVLDQFSKRSQQIIRESASTPGDALLAHIRRIRAGKEVK